MTYCEILRSVIFCIGRNHLDEYVAFEIRKLLKVLGEVDKLKEEYSEPDSNLRFDNVRAEDLDTLLYKLGEIDKMEVPKCC